jgi:hypothetical protein
LKPNNNLPKVLINSVPKSGTNLLIQIINGIPKLQQNQTVLYHKDNYREALNIQKGKFVCGHIRYNNKTSSDFRQHSIKQVFIYRDLRDVAVSMHHFIIDKFHRHPLYAHFKNNVTNHEEQLLALIQGIQLPRDGGIYTFPGIYEEYKLIYGWKNDPSVCSIRFEDLVKSEASKQKEIRKIIDFLWEDLQGLQLSKNQLQLLMTENINPDTSWTFRKGKAGTWRDEFTTRHKEAFKRVTGNFLIELGYEKNHRW